MAEQLKTILRDWDTIENDNAARVARIESFEKIYFMELEKKTPPGWDAQDLRYYISPNGRNKVVGVTDLLSNTDPIVTVEGKNRDAIKDAVEKMITGNNQGGVILARDVGLSAALYGEVHLVSKRVSVMIERATTGIQKKRLELLAEKTPYIIKVLNPGKSFPAFGTDGYLRSWHEKYEAKGRELKNEWEGADGIEGLDDDGDYIVRDGFTLTHRLVAVEGIDTPLMFEEHGLDEFPVVVRYARGSNLFDSPERRMEALLSAYEKSEAFEAESIILSAGLTHTLATGFGPLYEGEAEDGDMTLEVDNQGPIRLIYANGGKIRLSNARAFDDGAMGLHGLLKNIGDESTMHGQALGAPMQGKQAFSTVSILQSSGRLPLASIQDCDEAALAEIFRKNLRDMAANNPAPELLGADKLKEDWELSIKLDVKLSQDAMREAQMASQLSGKVSEEYLLEEVLHIRDAKAEKRKVWKEMMRDEIIKGMIPQAVQESQRMAAALFGGGQAQDAGAPAPEQAGNAPTPQQMAAMQMQAQGGANVAQVGGPQEAMAGGARLPMDAPKNPEELG